MSTSPGVATVEVGGVLRSHPAFVAFGIHTVLVLAVLSLLVTIGPWPGGLVPNGDLVGGGTTVLQITPSARALTSADSDAIVRAVRGVTLISRVVFGTARITAGDRGPTSDNRSPTIGVQAVDPSYALDSQAKLARGAFFTAADATAANRVAVLDVRAADSLFSAGQSPVGRTIQIRNVPFTVIGVLASQAGSAGDGLDGSVLIPFQTGQVRLFGATGLGEILLQVRDPLRSDALVQQVQELLRMRHQVRSGQPDGFTIAPRPSSGSGLAAQYTDRLLNLSRQYACQTKRLCLPTPTL